MFRLVPQFCGTLYNCVACPALIREQSSKRYYSSRRNGVIRKQDFNKAHRLCMATFQARRKRRYQPQRRNWQTGCHKACHRYRRVIRTNVGAVYSDCSTAKTDILEQCGDDNKESRDPAVLTRENFDAIGRGNYKLLFIDANGKIVARSWDNDRSDADGGEGL